MTPDERRAAIVRATVPLLRDRGISVTTRELAEAAEVAEGTLFRVFPDKPALLRAAVEQALDPAPAVAALAAIAHAADLHITLGEVVRVMLSRSRDVTGLLVALHQLDETDGPSTVHAAGSHRRLTGFHHGAPGSGAAHPLEMIGKALVSVLEPYRSQLRREPSVCARLLMAIILTASRPNLAGIDPALTADDIVELFLDGVLTTQEPPC
jgi:AcrR family transcriptional regulator